MHKTQNDSKYLKKKFSQTVLFVKKQQTNKKLIKKKTISDKCLFSLWMLTNQNKIILLYVWCLHLLVVLTNELVFFVLLFSFWGLVIALLSSSTVPLLPRHGDYIKGWAVLVPFLRRKWEMNSWNLCPNSQRKSVFPFFFFDFLLLSFLISFNLLLCFSDLFILFYCIFLSYILLLFFWLPSKFFNFIFHLFIFL